MNLFEDLLRKYPPSDTFVKPSEGVLNQFRNRLPDELLDLWRTYGVGNILYYRKLAELYVAGYSYLCPYVL